MLDIDIRTVHGMLQQPTLATDLDLWMHCCNLDRFHSLSRPAGKSHCCYRSTVELEGWANLAVHHTEHRRHSTRAEGSIKREKDPLFRRDPQNCSETLVERKEGRREDSPRVGSAGIGVLARVTVNIRTSAGPCKSINWHGRGSFRANIHDISRGRMEQRYLAWW